MSPLIEHLLAHPSTAKTFRDWYRDAYNSTGIELKEFSDLPETMQVGVLLLFFNKHNLNINAYSKAYDIYFLKQELMASVEQRVIGVVYEEYDGDIYIERGKESGFETPSQSLKAAIKDAISKFGNLQ
jgi:hypothetical protein